MIETRRGHTLGRVYWSGSAQADSGQPDGDPRRVLRAPQDGVITAHANIGDHLKEGQLIAEIDLGTPSKDTRATRPPLKVNRKSSIDNRQSSALSTASYADSFAPASKSPKA